MHLSFLAGTTSKIVQIPVYDSSSTTGGMLTGLAFNTASLVCWYNREGAAGSAVQISLLTATKGTWTTAGFVAVDGTNLPGWYELHVPNAAIASGAKSVAIEVRGATNMVPVNILIELTATDNQDSVRGGMTALPNAAAAASGGVPVLGTNATAISFTAGMTISSSAGDALTLTSSGGNGDGLQASGNGTGAGINCVAGATGNGILSAGGATSGSAIKATGTAGNAIALELAGQGSAAGLSATGGATGIGITAVGGATSGTAIKATGSAGNAIALELVGQGSAAGLSATGGATGIGITAVGGATSGSGFKTTGTAGNAIALEIVGQGSAAGIQSTGGATGSAFKLVGGATSGHGLAVTTTAGDGFNLTPTAGSGITSTGNGTSKHGIVATGGTAGTSDGLKAAAGTGGVDIRGGQTGDVTGNLSGSVGSVTGAVGSVTGAVGSVTGSVGSVSGAVGSVTGNVGGNVVGSVASVTARVTANADQWAGTTIPAPAVTGVPKVDLVDIAGATVSTSTAQLGVNAVQIGAAVPGSATIGTVTTVTTATNLTNAPTAGDFTATMKTSLNAATPASVIGNVGGNVVGSVGSVTAAVSLSTSDSPVVQSGTAQAGGGSTITLAAGASATDNLYNGQTVKTIAGTGPSQVRVILSYVGATKVATVDRAWATNPDVTTTYAVLATDQAKTNSSLEVVSASVTGSVASVTADVGITQTGADKVWSTATRALTDKIGFALSSAGVQAIWDALTSALTTVGSIGKLLVTDIDAAISSRSTYAGADTSGTTTLLSRLTGTRATNLDNLDAAVSTRSSHSASDVWAVGTRTLTAFTIAVDITGTAVSSIWDKLLTGITAASTIGKLIKDNLDAAISSRSAFDAGVDTVTVGTNNDKTGYRLSATGVDDVWDEATSGHTTSGTTGQALIDASLGGGDPWATALPGSYGAGTAGSIVGTNLDAAVSTRSSHSAADVWAVGTRTLTAFTIAVDITSAAVSLIWDKLLTGITTASTIGKLIKDNLDAAVSSRSTYAGADTSGTTTLLGRLTSTRAGNLDNLDAAVTTRLASAGYTAPDNSDIVAIKAKTDNLPVSPAAVSDIPTAAANASATWDAVRASHTTSGTFGQGVSSVQGNVTGSTASVTDKAGFTLTAAYDPAKTAAQAGDAMALTSGERDSVATAALKLDWTGIVGEASRSTLNALRFLRNKWSFTGTTLTVTAEDDTTSAWTGEVTTSSSAQPITSVDPT